MRYFGRNDPALWSPSEARGWDRRCRQSKGRPLSRAPQIQTEFNTLLQWANTYFQTEKNLDAKGGCYRNTHKGTSLVVKVKTLPSNAGVAGSNSGRGSNILHASGPKKPKHKTKAILLTNSIKVLFFSLEDNLLYNIVLVSAIHQHESAIVIHMSSPS